MKTKVKHGGCAHNSITWGIEAKKNPEFQAQLATHYAQCQPGLYESLSQKE